MVQRDYLAIDDRLVGQRAKRADDRPRLKSLSSRDRTRTLPPDLIAIALYPSSLTSKETVGPFGSAPLGINSVGSMKWAIDTAGSVARPKPRASVLSQ